MKEINCLIVDDEATAREILTTYVSHVTELNLVASCSNAQQAFEVLEKERIDLIFLDIKMPGISGITLAKALKDEVKVIFTTAYRDYAVEGFDLQAVDYLLKPISPERFHQAIHKFKTESSAQSQGQDDADKDFIMVRADRKVMRLKWNEIQYIESFGDYLKIHLENQIIVTRETISSIEANLPEEHFLRIHRSFLVFKQAITAFTKEKVELGTAQLPISRTYKAKVSESLS